MSHDTFFKMADNSDSDEGPIKPTEKAKRLQGANLATPEKAKIARERKIQTNLAGKNRKKTNFKGKQEKKSNYSATFSKFSNFTPTSKIE